MNQYPAKPLMDQMAQYGRYGDTMLVHMNPAEVAGIASLVPGGLTTNPVTGQPEAFAFLIPMLAGAAGISMSPLVAGAVTGAVTAIAEKDIGKGLLAGIGGMASGALGEGLGELLGTGADAATQTALQTGTEGAAELGQALAGTTEAAASAAQGVPTEILGAELASNANTAATAAQMAQAQQLATPTADMLAKLPSPNDAVQGSMFNRVDAGIRSLGTMGQLGILGASQGAIGDMEMREAQRRQANALRKEGEASRQESYGDLQMAYGVGQPGVASGISPYRSEMSKRTLPPMYAAQGGQVRRMAEGGKAEDSKSTATTSYNVNYTDPYATALGAARFFGVGSRGYGGIDPVTVQANLRPRDVVAPPKDYMAGFEPEFSYFQDTSEGIMVPDRSYRPLRQGVINQGSYFDPILQAPQSNAQMQEYYRTLSKLDPGPTDPESVMGLASRRSVLSPVQQSMLESYYSQPPEAPETTTTTGAETPSTDLGEFELTDTIRGYFPGKTDQEIRDILASYQSGNIFNFAANIADPNAINAIALSMQAGLGPNDVSPLSSPEALMALYPSLTEEQARALASLSINSIPFSAGGDVPEVTLKTSLGETSVPSGGIAQLPTEFTGASEQQKRLNKMTGLPFDEEGEDVKRDVQALESAVLGEIEESLANEIIEMFVQKYGPDIYRVARESILRRAVPNAQTEGMISGPGGGMDDMVQGMIGNEQPVAVSPGEFIVPADVVSGLGDGSSDAGAEKLDMMMERVRMERNGTTRQAPQIDERKVMPA
jgi:hypothetical protein